MNNELTIIIPAYNEELTIKKVLQDIRGKNLSFLKEIIVVDDGSTDKTSEIVKTLDVKIIKHKINRGYGASIKTGIKESTTEFVMTYDADGQHYADDIEKLWNAIDDRDLIIGARTAIIHSKLWRMPGKWFLRLLASYIVNRKIKDLNSGLRLFRKSVICKYLHICSDAFSFSTTSTMVLLCRGYSVKYTPIKVKKREGHSKVTVKTGFNTIVLVLRMASLFSPLRLFIPLSLICFFSGFFWALPILLSREGLSVGALFAMLTGIVLFTLGLISDQISQLRLERFE